MQELNLPSEVRPIWVEGVFTAEFEKDTLPLLFADEQLFEQYYATLIDKNPHVAAAIVQLLQRNQLARRQRAEGVWQDCVESLAQCVELRRCIFNEADFQHTAAQKHYVLALLNFATFFLRESMRAKTAEAMLMRSFELFKLAETAVGQIANREDRMLLKVAVENNFATYYAKRKKFSAAAQRMNLAFRAWTPLKHTGHTFYFDVQRGSGEIFSNRFDEGLRILKKAAGVAPKDAGKRCDPALAPSSDEKEREDKSDSSSEEDEAEADGGPPARAGALTYSLLVLNCALPVEIGAAIALNHNIGVGLVGLRRYKEAGPWCTKAMDLCVVHSNVLTARHAIVVAIRDMQLFCERMCFTTKFQEFKMKQDDHSSTQHRKMQAAVAEARVASAGSSRGGAKTDPVVRKASADPKSAAVGQLYMPGRGVRYRKPTEYEALRTYVKHMSYRQLIEEFGIGHKQQPRPPAPKPGDKGASASSKKDAAKEADGAAGATDVPPSPRSSRSSSRRSSRSRSSSNASSPERRPKDTPREEARTAAAGEAKPVDSPRTPSIAETPSPKKHDDQESAGRESPRTPSVAETPTSPKREQQDDPARAGRTSPRSPSPQATPRKEQDSAGEAAPPPQAEEKPPTPPPQAEEKPATPPPQTEEQAPPSPVAEPSPADAAAPVPALNDLAPAPEPAEPPQPAAASSPEKLGTSYADDFDATQSTTSELSPLKSAGDASPKNTTYGNDSFESDS